MEQTSSIVGYEQELHMALSEVTEKAYVRGEISDAIEIEWIARDLVTGIYHPWVVWRRQVTDDQIEELVDTSLDNRGRQDAPQKAAPPTS